MTAGTGNAPFMGWDKNISMALGQAYSLHGKRVFVAGHRGMVGSGIVRRLRSEGCEILTAGRDTLDLLDQAVVRAWFADQRPDAVFLAAARVGGILANDSFPVDFLYENLVIETNVIDAAYRSQVEKLLFLGSSCIYPKLADQPIREEALLTGPLEPTNQWYAIAKIAGIKLAQAYRTQYGCDYISAMPTNLYGPGDNYNFAGSHVLPALIRKAHDAKQANADSFEIWGTGSPLREFLHVDDMADACVHLMKTYSEMSHINVGSSEEISIADLAALVAEVIGYDGDIVCDTSKPDGTMRKRMDSSRLYAMGWRPRIDLRSGIANAYSDFLDETVEKRGIIA